MANEAQQLLKILEAVHSNEIGVEEGQLKVEKLSMKEFGSLYANLHHYWDDEDTREKDFEYEQLQKNELGKVINHLRNGDVDAANKVSFLHVS